MSSTRQSPEAASSIRSSERPTRVAIIGARGIGRVHARIFHALGADVCAVVGSSAESAADASSSLARAFGIEARAYPRMEDIPRHDVDAVSICTPSHLHCTQALAAFERGWSVFCEKPLFWWESISAREIGARLAQLRAHPARGLFINTSNASFIDSVRTELPDPRVAESFSFHFYTQGPFRGAAIGVDLLPHALSLLLRALGTRTIADIRSDVSAEVYRCFFRYGGAMVDFDLRQREGGPRALGFGVGTRHFVRLQEGSMETYKVFLEPVGTSRRLEVRDPFEVYIERFLRYCSAGSRHMEDAFEEAATNLSLMAQILGGGIG